MSDDIQHNIISGFSVTRPIDDLVWIGLHIVCYPKLNNISNKTIKTLID